jgi:hypothetical protein
MQVKLNHKFKANVLFGSNKKLLSKDVHFLLLIIKVNHEGHFDMLVKEIIAKPSKLSNTISDVTIKERKLHF